MLKPPVAMILAAGLGTRLKPLTDTMPKALVPYQGKPLLEGLLDRLESFHFSSVVINVHHFADMIEDFIAANRAKWNMDIVFSDERDLLRDTGGAIRNARKFLEGSPFLVHNVDIITDFDLGEFYDGFLRSQSTESAPLATLLVSRRETSRYFLFDDGGLLVGWTNVSTGEVKSPFGDIDSGKYRKLAFSGIHMLSPEVFGMMECWPEKFSIVDFYLNLTIMKTQTQRVDCLESTMENKILDVGKLSQL